MNPATEQPIASVTQASNDDYERAVTSAVDTFKEWRMLPAPQRGDYVRQIGNALRDHKAQLGALVSMEMGKIRAEGEGEVQEMIDIADFAVGLSRQLYGLTIASERPRHRMYEQWHPLGPIGIITAFNFPVAVWSWNAFIAAVCGDTMVWKPAPQTPLTGVAVTNICHQVMAGTGFEGVFNLAAGTLDDVAKPMVDDARLPLISATGSVRMGAQVGQAVAARLGKSILELGGN
ncbi:MAG: aldehyde dehydrogenase family protein, partial [Acidimicrobiia bacterium]|nr:aldehyde dehydrogenase family protein [Acidimicrobiia bacterium]